MPIHNQFCLDQNGRPSAEALALAGPVLQVEISIPAALATQLNSKGEDIPSPEVGWAMFDTGASVTCVDEKAISRLGVKAVGETGISTPAGTDRKSIFPATISFPIQNLKIDHQRVVGANLENQKIGGSTLIALIGRDVLSRFILIYNGPAGHWSLSL